MYNMNAVNIQPPSPCMSSNSVDAAELESQQRSLNCQVTNSPPQDSHLKNAHADALHHSPLASIPQGRELVFPVHRSTNAGRQGTECPWSPPEPLVTYQVVPECFATATAATVANNSNSCTYNANRASTDYEDALEVFTASFKDGLDLADGEKSNKCPFDAAAAAVPMNDQATVEPIESPELSSCQSSSLSTETSGCSGRSGSDSGVNDGGGVAAAAAAVTIDTGTAVKRGAKTSVSACSTSAATDGVGEFAKPRSPAPLAAAHVHYASCNTAADAAATTATAGSGSAVGPPSRPHGILGRLRLFSLSQDRPRRGSEDFPTGFPFGTSSPSEEIHNWCPDVVNPVTLPKAKKLLSTRLAFAEKSILRKGARLHETTQEGGQKARSRWLSGRYHSGEFNPFGSTSSDFGE
nr:unnamed protein product [Spirometra erinaceieuropaei]